MVKGALFTYVRPEPAEEPELVGISEQAMIDIGLKEGEEKTEEFKNVVAGNKMFWEASKGGIYPWAQCYGGQPRTRAEDVTVDDTDGAQDGNCTLIV